MPKGPHPGWLPGTAPFVERVLLNVYDMVRLYLLGILRKDNGQDTIIEGSMDIIFLDTRHRELTA